MSTFKQQLFQHFAVIGQALSSGPRLEILEQLGQKPRSVDELSQVTGYTVANTSRHLQVLKNAGLVSMRKDGKARIYAIASNSVYALFNNLRCVAEQHLADIPSLINAFLSSKDPQEAISADEFAERFMKGELTLLDIRPEEEFRAAHIPGAINIPPDRLGELQNLPMDQEYVAYCRGPYCVFSYDAVNLLRQKGATAHRLESGLPEWRLDGRPLAFD